jgi:hypothetical protein
MEIGEPLTFGSYPFFVEAWQNVSTVERRRGFELGNMCGAVRVFLISAYGALKLQGVRGTNGGIDFGRYPVDFENVVRVYAGFLEHSANGAEGNAKPVSALVQHRIWPEHLNEFFTRMWARGKARQIGQEQTSFLSWQTFQLFAVGFDL